MKDNMRMDSFTYASCLWLNRVKEHTRKLIRSSFGEKVSFFRGVL